MRTLQAQGTIADTNLTLLGIAPQPQVVGFTHTNTGYQSVVVSGSYAYALSTGGDSAGVIGLTLTIFNVANPTAPFYTSYITTGSVRWTTGASFLNGSYIAAIQGNYLYIGSAGSVYLYIVNITDPTNPFNVSFFTPSGASGSIYGTAIQGNYAYLATQNLGLVAVNVSNPLVPAQTFEEGGTLNKSIGVFVQGNYVYTTNFQTAAPWTVRFLKIWSLANPAIPSLIETFTLLPGTKPSEVTVNGNLAFVSDLNTSSIQIIDITNPLAPVYLSSLQASANFDVTNTADVINMNGRYAYVTSGANATYGGAIDFFDISNPSAPIKVKTLQQGVAGSLFTGSTLYGNLLYVANYGVSPSYMGSLNIYSTQKAIAAPIDTTFMNSLSVQIDSSTSTVSGGFYMQGSSDGINYNVIPNTNGTITGIGSALLTEFPICYNYVQLVYINTGTGPINYVVKGSGLS